jgi:hypothetical protein
MEEVIEKEMTAFKKLVSSKLKQEVATYFQTLSEEDLRAKVKTLADATLQKHVDAHLRKILK